MNKFKIICPECNHEFSLTLNEYHYFNELQSITYNDNVELKCPNCGYLENDKEV